MHRQLWRYPTIAIVVSALCTSAIAQPECHASSTSEWLRPPSNLQQDATIKALYVRPVSRNIAIATSMLKDQQFVEVRERDAVRFTGPAFVPEPADRNLRLYIVRAVFPTSRPNLSVRWSGNDLHVTAAGLGCSPFTNHPILIFLDRKPAVVFVTASAAL